MVDMTPATLDRLQHFAANGPYVLREFDAERLAAIQAARSEGHSYAEIGRALGISRQRVHQLLAERGTNKP
jgi:DNA invertase Pin-like site-specific DNA recombinase